MADTTQDDALVRSVACTLLIQQCDTDKAKWSYHRRHHWLTLQSNGVTIPAMAEAAGVSVKTVSQALALARTEAPPS